MLSTTRWNGPDSASRSVVVEALQSLYAVQPVQLSIVYDLLVRLGSSTHVTITPVSMTGLVFVSSRLGLAGDE